MRQVFTAYPAGFGGLALLLLRGSSAIFLFTLLFRFNPPPWAALILATIAAAIVLGIFTRIVASLCAAIAVLALLSMGRRTLPGLPPLFDAVALAMIGPGAFSVDARRFGRRIINLAD